MDRKGYPKAYASWGGSGFEAINALLEPGAELVARSADCEAVETISLSDKRSDPKTRKIVFFADCIAADWSYTRFYVTDTQIRSGEIPVSEKSRAAAAPRDQLTAACYTALRSRMKYPSAFDPSGLRTEVAVFQSDSASAEVRTSFEAKNDLGAVLPHLGVCSLHGKKEPALFDLYADPKAWPDGREISAAARAQHAEHLAAFAGAITGADVQFASATYAQGCQAWLRRPGAVQEHTRAVMSHFQIA